MKELTIGEMESISGGFNLFGFANSITSLINNTASHLSDFITSAGATIANAIVNGTVEFGKFLTGTSDWQISLPQATKTGAMLCTTCRASGTLSLTASPPNIGSSFSRAGFFLPFFCLP
jgi:hypothetical protein